MLSGRHPFRAATAMGVLNRFVRITSTGARSQCIGTSAAGQVVDRLLANAPGTLCISRRAGTCARRDHARLKAGRLKLTSQLLPTRIIKARNRAGLAVAHGIGSLCPSHGRSGSLLWWQPFVRTFGPGGMFGPGMYGWQFFQQHYEPTAVRRCLANVRWWNLQQEFLRPHEQG